MRLDDITSRQTEKNIVVLMYDRCPIMLAPMISLWGGDDYGYSKDSGTSKFCTGKTAFGFYTHVLGYVYHNYVRMSINWNVSKQ